MSSLVAALFASLAMYLVFPLPKLTKPAKVLRHKKAAKYKVSIQDTRQYIELLILALTSGMTTPTAIKQSCLISDSHFAQELSKAVKAYELGANFEVELQDVGAKDKYWKFVTNLLRQSWEQGSAITENLTELNAYLVDLERAQILKKVRSAAVKSVIPLGVCFLPAFIAVVVVPIVAGLSQ